MDNDKKRRRVERSLAFFADKRKGKYKRVKTSETSKSVARVPRNDSLMVSNESTEPRNDYSTYFVNIVITQYTLILTDRFQRQYPTVDTFFDNIRNYFRRNVNIILYTRDSSEIETAAKASCRFDLTVSLDKYDGLTAKLKEHERPLRILRKCIARQATASPHSLSGPFVLIVKSIDGANNKQYDIVKDIRRYYKYDEINFRDTVDLDSLFHDIKESVEHF